MFIAHPGPFLPLQVGLSIEQCARDNEHAGMLQAPCQISNSALHAPLISPLPPVSEGCCDAIFYALALQMSSWSPCYASTSRSWPTMKLQYCLASTSPAAHMAPLASLCDLSLDYCHFCQCQEPPLPLLPPLHHHCLAPNAPLVFPHLPQLLYKPKR